MTEVIIIFGAAIRPDGTPSPALIRRVATAARWGLDRDAQFLVTGGVVVAPPAEAHLMAAQLEGAGIASDRIVIENQALTTLQSVRLCTPLLEKLTPTRVIVCTDDFHMRRGRWLLRLAGYRTDALVARPERNRLWPRLREWLALPVDTLLWLIQR